MIRPAPPQHGPRHRTGSPKRPKPSVGFTLTELLVAVAIAGLLVLAVAQVFSSVADAVDRGTSTGRIINAGRTVADQFRRDAAQMVGPREGAVMVIANKQTDPVAILPDDIDDGVSRNVRSDQLMFIRRRADLQPLGPSGSDSLSNASSAEYVKVWIGHTLRAEPGGGPPSTNALSQPALEWTLGRQAMFLESDRGAATADAAFIDADTDDLGIAFNATLRHGLSDVAHYGLAAERSDNDPTNDQPNEHGAMTGDERPQDGSGLNDGPPLHHDRRLWRTLPAHTTGGGGYADRAYDYTYLEDRLLSRAVPTGGTYEAWKVAQMHPILAGHVTDVIVEFAGDYFTNGSAEFGPATSPDDVSGLGATPDGEIDRYHDATGDQQIIWYGRDIHPPLSPTPTAPQGGFVDGQQQTPSQAPILDASPPGDADRAYVFRHGPGNTNWPHLIRIRYRLHDPAGLIRGTDDRPGVWFEQVLHVNRDG